MAWVFFRAESLDGAIYILKGMVGMNGLVLPYRWLEKWGAVGEWLAAHGVEFHNLPTFGGGGQVNFIIISLIIVWALPNTQQLLSGYRPALNVPDSGPSLAHHWWRWRPTAPWLALGIVTGVWAILSISELSEFIYFQF